jgi:crotonobetaine/carnitine-CoA ligase
MFLNFGADSYTYAVVDHESTRLAHGLIALGVGRGDTVATMLDNSIDAVLVWIAINKVGAVLVPLNTALKGDYLRMPLADSLCKLLIAEADYAERIEPLIGEIAGIRTVVWRNGLDGPASLRTQTLSLSSARSLSDHPLEDVNRPSDLCMLIYTAGTTGAAKGCMVSHNYLCNLARQAIDSMGYKEGDIFWTPLPLFHINAAANVTAVMLAGAGASIYPRFSLSNFWPAIARSRATIISLLGSMILLIADAADTEQSSACFGQIRVVSGAPFTAALQEKWLRRFGVQIARAPGYGLTEAAMITSLRVTDNPPSGSAGRRNDDFEACIVDDEDNELPAGTTGELVCRPRRPHVMFAGYWKRPEETLQTFRNLWFHTGDVGRFDPAGYFYFVDRKKDCIRRRGENVSSVELETVLRMHPGIVDVAVHAVSGSLGEDEIKVTAIVASTGNFTEETLCRWLMERVPYFAVPTYIEFRSDLPRNAVGRVLKHELRTQGVTALTWDRERAGVAVEKR